MAASPLLVLGAERIDPVDFKPTVAGADVHLMTVEQTGDMVSDTVQHKVEPAARGGRACEREFAPVDHKNRRSVAITQRDFTFALGLPEHEIALAHADGSPARSTPR